MIIIGILCTILGICRICNAISSNDERFEKIASTIESPIEINPNVLRASLIIIGLIETMCGLWVWFNV